MFGINKSKKKSQDSEAQAKANEKNLNLRQSIENHVSIHAFPRQYKTTPSPQSGSKTKLIGTIIIVLGVLFMLGLIYGAYVFLIKPQTSPQSPIVETKEETTKEAVVDKTVDSQKEAEVKSDPQGIIKKKEEETEKVIEKVATTTEAEIVEDEELLLAIDSDGDGLSDREEFLLGTNPSIIDTDGDTYADGVELLGLYNPNGSDRLVDNPAITDYQGSFLKYSLLYPAKWTTQETGDNGSVVFSIGAGAFINVLVQDNNEGEDIETWLTGLLPAENIDLDRMIVRDDWTGIWHKNQKVFYLTDSQKKNIFVIDYALAPEKTLDYHSIFKMMINSFTLAN